MIKPSTIDTSKVTADQIGACYRVFEGSIACYKVQSESNDWKEYTVRYSSTRGFTCTCKSGEVAFSNTKAGFCKHVLWAVACSREEKAALAIIEATPAHSLTLNGKPATEEEYNAVVNAKPGKPSNAKCYQPQAFSLPTKY